MAGLLRPEVADRLGDAGVSVFNFAMDSWDLKPSLPKALVPAQKNSGTHLRKQYVDGYLVFFNMNICRNNTEDIRKLTNTHTIIAWPPITNQRDPDARTGRSLQASVRQPNVYPPETGGKSMLWWTG